MSKKIVLSLLGTVACAGAAVVGYKVYKEFQRMDEENYEKFMEAFGFGKDSLSKITTEPCPFKKSDSATEENSEEKSEGTPSKDKKAEEKETEASEEEDDIRDMPFSMRVEMEVTDTVSDEDEDKVGSTYNKPCTYGCGCDGNCMGCVAPERCKTSDLDSNTEFSNNESDANSGPVPEEVITLQKHMIDDLVNEDGTERNVYKPEYFKSTEDAKAYDKLLLRCDGDEKKLFDALTTLFGTLDKVNYSKLV